MADLPSESGLEHLNPQLPRPRGHRQTKGKHTYMASSPVMQSYAILCSIYLLIKKGTTPASFCLFSFFSNTNFTYIKICTFCGIWTRIVEVGWRLACWPLDHHQNNVPQVHKIKKGMTPRDGQRLWLSWHSSCFRYLRSAVRIQSSARFYNEHICC